MKNVLVARSPRSFAELSENQMPKRVQNIGFIIHQQRRP